MSPPDYVALRFYFDVLVALGLLANFFWGIADRKNRATQDQLEEHKGSVNAKLNGLGERLARAEQSIAAGPTHADLARIYETVNEVRLTVARLVGENSTQTDLLRQLVNKEIRE